MIKDFYSLTKSGLVFGNLIPFIAGFALGSRGAGDAFSFPLFFITAAGLLFVMAAGCVFNNYIDSDIDGAMERTRDRALVRSQVSPRAALAFGTILGAAGFLALVLFANALAVGAAIVGFFFYVFMYSAWSKRRSVWGTLVGAVSGATPPVVGYAAASGRIDLAALILFAIMIFWQMPHFYAIAIRRHDDYAAAKIPVLPVKSGVRAAKIQMVIYIAAFTIAAPSLAALGYLSGTAGRAYFILAIILGLAWLALGFSGFSKHKNPTHDNKNAQQLWARKMFFTSLIVMVVLFAALTISAVVG